MGDTKVCTRCKNELPRDSSHFYRDRSNNDGFNCYCKRCHNKIKNAYLDAKRQHNPNRRRPIEERFWDKVNKSTETGCWEWASATTPKGYGIFSLCMDGETGKQVKIYAHRFSYMLQNGIIPDGMFICHHCDNPKCVNPEHLHPGTAADNTHDMISRGRNAVITGENSHLSKLTNGQVLQICKMYGAGQHPKAIARYFGVTDSTVRSVAAGFTWKAQELPVTSGRRPLELTARFRKQRKLGVGEIADIRRSVAGGERQSSMAAKYGVSISVVSRIIANKVHKYDAQKALQRQVD